MKNLLALVVIWWVACGVHAAVLPLEKARFAHLACDRGLSQNNVKSIVKDADGFLWFGTKNGLNRFDGTSVVRKVCRDGAVEGHDISALCAGRDGTLWIGTERGLFSYQPKTDTFTYIDSQTKDGKSISRWVLNVTEDREGNIWIVAPAQGVFRWCNGGLSCYPVLSEGQLARTPLSHLYVRGNGEVWLATWGNGMYRYSSAKNAFVPCVAGQDGKAFSELKIVMMADYGGGLALGIHEGRLLFYEPEDGNVSELPCEGLSSTMVRTLAVMDGRLWIGTYAGVFIWHEGRTVHWEKASSDTSGLSDDVIYAMYPDGNGMWLGTLNGGVNHVFFTEQDFMRYTPDGRKTPFRVREMIADGAGNVWVATENAGLCRWNARRSGLEYKGLGTDTPLVLSLACHGKELYCGTFMHGLYTVNTETGAVSHESSAELGLEEESIYALHVDKDGNKWLGTDHGLYMAGADNKRFRKIRMKEDAWVVDIHEAPDGTLWLGTMGSGLWAFQPDKGLCRKYRHKEGDARTLSGNSVNSVMQDSKGRLWVSTDGNGLCCLDKKQRAFIAYSVKDGLPDDVVYDVLEGEYGYLWAGTNQGLVRLNPDNGTVHVYTTEDGLPENRFNYRSSLKSGHRLLFGTVDGIIAFTPLEEIQPDTALSLFLTRFAVNNKEYDVVPCEDGNRLSPVYADHIRLRHDESNICFGMALTDYQSPSSCRYYYRMEPLDEDWVMATDPKNISYAHLAPGAYQLHLKAVSGRTGVASEREVQIVILPPWWCTWWSYTLYIMACVGLVIMMVANYRRRLERRMRIRQRFFELEKQKEVYEAKMRMLAEQGDRSPESAEVSGAAGVQPSPVLPEEKPVAVPVRKKEVSAADKEWADRIYQVVNDNLMDESFNVEAMADILCMSRSTLLRRFKQTFDCSPVELIRMLRLNKAAELIGEGRYRISDIGYMVGFSSASYFSKNFQKQFGMAPKDYARHCRDAKVKIDAACHFRVPEPAKE